MNADRMRAPLPDDAPHVLVVDDDRRLRDLLARFLGDNGYRVTVAADAAEADTKLSNVMFDVLVLDVMMPGENGFDFAVRLRRDKEVPILMLTARTEPADRVQGLETGVEDYLSKPFEPRELLLRLGNILRRSAERTATPADVEQVRFGPFLFRLDRGELRKDGDILRLTDREREILVILSARRGDNVPRDVLAGQGAAANERTVDVQINRLRRKIEVDPANPAYLQTVRGIGYRLLIDG
ncbi:response regulator [Chelatococcus reniformis]|uniref:DNA-binding response regulator n=1 Tax=Chelatococcus reniformis TaxID=1494448 RepID=A0A916UPF7_9HYPH|nr:response regulator transcription factor [Chelatococcus reniformis]GGC80359.1 DNA-binding response regulator [Chelatococcus reniformis]